MADHRIRNHGNSIFSDDDRGGNRWRSEDHGWGGNPGRGDESGRSAPEDRGFFERVGDEVRSWLGDDEAERRREQDARRQERDTPGSHLRQPDQWTGRGADRDNGARSERNRLRSNQASPQTRAWGDDTQGGFGDGGFGGVPAGRGDEQRFGGHHDETYRRWRDEQIAALDREYEDYRSHRQQQFEQDFSNFRQSRATTLATGGAALSPTGAADTAQVSTRPAAAGADTRQSAGDLTTGTETVTAEPPSEQGSRPARSR